VRAAQLEAWAPGVYANGQRTQGVIQGYGDQVATHGYESLPMAYAMNMADVNMGQQIYNTAFDPQQALYNRTSQQLTDQTRAALAARGLDMSGVGAGIEGHTMGDFNLNWQNAQLGRQIAGGNAAGSLYSQGLGGIDNALNTGNNTVTQAGNLQSQGLQAYLNAANTAGNFYSQAGQLQDMGLSGLTKAADSLGGMYRTQSALAGNPFASQLALAQSQQAGSQGVYGNRTAQAQGLGQLAGYFGGAIGQAGGNALGNVDWGSLFSSDGGSVPSSMTSAQVPAWLSGTY